MNSVSSLDILAIVAEKEQQLTMPMYEKKALPFNLNFKPRTNRRPHSSPMAIDIHALLPCLDRKRKLDDDDQTIRGITDSSGEVRNFKKMRLTIRLVPPKLPLEYQRKIAELGGSDVKLVIQKKLKKSDVKKKKNKGHLTMPYRECQVDFGAIQEMMLVKVIQPANMLSEMILSFQVNGLQIGDVVQVWSFRQEDALSFALIKL